MKSPMIKLQRTAMQGFTLVELMVVVAVIAIIASIAYPSYQDSVLKTNRTEGKAFLSEAAARQEKFFVQNNTYTASVAALGFSSANSPTSKYTLAISNVSGTTYTLTATPARTDSKCGNLTLDQAGVRGKSGSGSVNDCW
ncbi:Type IV fimbrial biogenesis protein [gamma proteobacterium HdN1]|nr:Type IV fimbrial biogenesis protein [gamma proteobacterium HdN1]